MSLQGRKPKAVRRDGWQDPGWESWSSQKEGLILALGWSVLPTVPNIQWELW